MSVMHLVLLDLDDTGGPEAMAALYARFKSALARIPGVEAVSIGRNFRAGSDKYNHAVAVRFADRAALEAFGPHPVHLEMIEFMKPYMRDVLVVDYEPA